MRFVHLIFIAVLLGTTLGKIFFEESFDDDSWSKRWVMSSHNGARYGRFETATGKFYANISNKGLKTRDNNRLYALSTTFPEFTNENKTLVLQYSVKYEQNIAKEDGCGGGFIKLFDCNLDPSDLHGGTPHLFTFGPDICGKGSEKIRLDINYKNIMYPVNRNISWIADVYTHVYTLILKPDQTFEILVDGKSVFKGNFENDWNFIPKRIMDPNVTKPWDWDDQPQIYDASDTKPKDWDQPKYIPDPDATKPIDWDKYMKKKWEPYMIPNPHFKGEWKPRIIHNPRYKGPWIHPEIDNPQGFDRNIYRFPRICGIGFELWQGQSGTIFDNILLADNPLVAEEKRRPILKGTKIEKEMKEKKDEEVEKIRMRASVRTARKFAVETPKVFTTNDGAKNNLETRSARQTDVQGDAAETLPPPPHKPIQNDARAREYERKQDELHGKLMATIYTATSLSVLVIAIGIISTYLVYRYRTKYQLTRKEMNDFLKGNSGPENYQGNGINVDGSGKAENQPYNKSKYEVTHSSFQIDLSRYLGAGEFGIVCLGTIKRGGTEVGVAVKMLNDRRSVGNQSQGSHLALKGLISEIKILSYVGEHEHILKLEGAYTEKLRMGRVLVFLELCELGSLEKYLRNYKPNGEGLNLLKSESMELGTRKLVLSRELSRDLERWAVEIASAMEYLSSKKIVHADLATRNVLLNSQKVAKIADFGLSRRLYNYCEYMKSESEPLPWRWMSPESLRKMIFNEKTDVWAFGVTLWEMFTLADEPYPGLSWDVNFATILERGLRLPEPKHNQDDYYSIMNQCWDIDPDRRPTFLELKSILSVKISHCTSEGLPVNKDF